jgi:hypothetical protein
MGFTSEGLFTGKHTRGTSADYGFDLMIYTLCGAPQPSKMLLDALLSRVTIICAKEEMTPEKMHFDYFMTKKYRELLGHGYEWVRTSKDMVL